MSDTNLEIKSQKQASLPKRAFDKLNSEDVRAVGQALAMPGAAVLTIAAILILK